MSKLKVTNQWKLRKMPKNKQSNLIANIKIRDGVLDLGLEGQVLGLGLEASSPRKLACPRLEDNTIFWIVKTLWSDRKIFWKTFFRGDRLENFCEDLFFLEIAWKILWRPFFFSLESTCACVLGPWPWPRAFLSLTSRVPVLGKALSLALASDFFVSLASSFVSSTLPLIKMPNISFINKYIINSEIRGKGEGGYSVLVNYPSLLSNIFPLAPPIIFL